MHESSMLKMAMLRDTYMPVGTRLLDVGSMAYHEADTYRPLFAGEYDYVGLDMVDGPNVDLVPVDPYNWEEIPDASFDAVISGQVFEHNPFFWITMAEVARVLRPGGIAVVAAPSRGTVHRYPLDCWRFYPDAGAALCAYVGLDHVESYVEPSAGRLIDGAEWGDFFLVARRPELSPTDLQRLAAIVGTRRPMPEPATSWGPTGVAYDVAVQVHPLRWRLDQLTRLAVGGLRRAARRMRSRSRRIVERNEAHDHVAG